MDKLEREIKVLQGKMEWARNKPTLKEKRQQKSNAAKLGKILEHAAYAMEAVESTKLINDNKLIRNTYLYFFPDAVEEVSDNSQTNVNQISNENVVPINFR